jgi:predicted short-subunit dehydrogenase-like oxidoreductase (DUF2520 family)
MKADPKVVLIGAGNVATHLGKALQASFSKVIQVYSFRQSVAKKLALKLDCAYTNDLSQLIPNADVYIVAIKDDSIKDVVLKINFQPSFIVHTSGTIPIEVLSKFKNYGVLYPLQTFSVNRKINLHKVPFFIEGNSPKSLNTGIAFASQMSPLIYKADSTKRKALHVSAVFACNFTNHMYAIAARILENANIPFKVLEPLILETSKKAVLGNPKAMQTGPAIRKDKQVLETHESYLKNEEVFKKIYTLVSKSIQDFSKKYGAT